jgi:hypothetical protein
MQTLGAVSRSSRGYRQFVGRADVLVSVALVPVMVGFVSIAVRGSVAPMARSRKAVAQGYSHVLVNRVGMGHLALNAEFRQEIEDNARLNF